MAETCRKSLDLSGLDFGRAPLSLKMAPKRNVVPEKWFLPPLQRYDLTIRRRQGGERATMAEAEDALISTKQPNLRLLASH